MSVNRETAAASRRQLALAHRIVVKLGTQVVTHDGIELALGRLMGIVESLARLRQQGREVVLVSSGAVGLGMRVLGLTERPRSLGLRQACAAVGQGHLIEMYTRAFSQLGVTVAQVLLTQEDLGDRDRALCLRTTLMRLLELRVIPILNENDSVSVKELVEYQRHQSAAAGSPDSAAASPPAPVFGDNDGLSARVAVALDADLLVLLTNVGGLFTANPAVDKNAQRVSALTGIDDQTLALAAGGSPGGTGGMASKLAAAQLAVAEGTGVLIASGAEPHVLERALAGEDLGTLIMSSERRKARWRRIASAARRCGALIVNEGALRALLERKASLLPIGVTAVEGNFKKGEVVEIRDGSGRVHGRALVNYDAAACRKLSGQKSEEIEQLLGWRGYDALVTRDNLVIGAL